MGGPSEVNGSALCRLGQLPQALSRDLPELAGQLLDWGTLACTDGRGEPLFEPRLWEPAALDNDRRSAAKGGQPVGASRRW